MKYTPLTNFLQGLALETKETTLRFSEIEQIIGAKLPKSARTYSEWWSNQTHGVQGPSWQAAGFIVDSVDLSRELIRFRRSSPPRRRRGKRAHKDKQLATPQDPIPVTALLEAGFAHCGHWRLNGDKLELPRDVPNRPGVYAHVVDGLVYYIGLAQMGLRKRLYFYGRPGKTQRTSTRINRLIKDELSEGRSVELAAAFPDPLMWKGLPVDTAAGLEAALIKQLQPPWNKRGL